MVTDLHFTSRPVRGDRHRHRIRLRSASIALAMAVGLTVLTGAAHAATYYVRTDGGSEDQCSGLADAPYPGSGSARACAWDHPFRALPPNGSPRISGGDTLIIRSGSYRMGYGAPGASACDRDAAWDCVMLPIPSGPGPDRPTRIVGGNAGASCTAAPELWGSERAEHVLDLTGSSNVEISCLEITDHSGCVEFHSGAIPCTRDRAPYGDWAVRGIYAADSSNVVLQQVNIHGLAAAGIHAGRLTDWTLRDVRIVANGWVGWDGDIEGDDSNSGTLRFTRWMVAWNGCGETWPENQPVHCWAQSAGGYGDGVGTGATTGRWIIEESSFVRNTSDGLDLLYARPGSSIEIRRTFAEGNAGNQIKTAGPAKIENSIIVGNCGFFDGNSVTFNVDDCRAVGNALSLTFFRGDDVSVTNSTIASEGDCAILADCADGACDGSERVVLRNNLVVGMQEFLDPTDRTCLIYVEGIPGNPVDADYSLIDGVKEDACPGPHDVCGQPPGVVDASPDTFDAHLTSGSPAIDRGTAENAPPIDFTGAARGSIPDIGAYEFGASRKNPRRRAVRP